MNFELVDEILVKEIKKYRCLYDLSFHGYRDKFAKENAWRAIGQSLNMEGDEMKKRWKSLRDKFTREKKKSLKKSGSEAQTASQWSLYPVMQFLEKQMEPRGTSSNYSVVLEENSLCESDVSGVESVCFPETVSTPETHSTPEPTKPTSQHHNQGKSKKRKPDMDLALLHALQKTTEETQDPEELFFLGVAGETKHWPTVVKCEFKLKIRTLMLDIEKKLESEK